MRILALDLSLTATGVAWTDRPEAAHVLAPKTKGVERLAWFARELAPQIRTAAVVVLEGYSYASKFVAHQTGELGGLVRLLCHQSRTPWVAVPPARLKMAATGKGNSAKDAMLVAAVRRLGYEGADHNVADALWLAEMAKVAYGLPGRVVLPKTHQRGVSEVDWPQPRRDLPGGRLPLPGLKTFPAARYNCDGCEDDFAPEDLAWAHNEAWVCPQCLDRCRSLDRSTLWTLDEVRKAYGR